MKAPGLLRTAPIRLGFGLATLVAAAVVSASGAAALKSDEELVLYPSIGWRSGNTLAGEVRGMVCEVEPRRLTLPMLTRALGFGDLSGAEKERFVSRARLFLVDHEHGKRFRVQLGSKEFTSGKSGQNGMFHCEWRLSREEGTELAARGGLLAEVVAGERRFQSRVMLWEDEGVTVVSDIDDTIKVSHVTDREALLRAALVDPYVAVPGMAAVYQRWARERRANFVYVSGSPWPLYGELSEFVEESGFPAGAFFLREFRFKDGTALQMLKAPEEHKRQSIVPLLKRFPARQFVLVGDSGEGDLEIYAGLAASYPRQVRRVLIRELAEAPVEAARREAALKRTGPGKLRLFKDSELELLSNTEGW